MEHLNAEHKKVDGKADKPDFIGFSFQIIVEDLFLEYATELANGVHGIVPTVIAQALYLRKKPLYRATVMLDAYEPLY